MEKLFVPHKEALALKELGFKNPLKKVLKGPLYQQVCDWIFEISKGKLIMFYVPGDPVQNLEKLQNMIETLKVWKKDGLLKFDKDG